MYNTKLRGEYCLGIGMKKTEKSFPPDVCNFEFTQRVGTYEKLLQDCLKDARKIYDLVFSAEAVAPA